MDRIEKDALGEVAIQSSAYYGIHSVRAKENFEITKEKVHKQMIKAVVLIKKAAAMANCDAGFLPLDKAKAISLACDEVLNNRFTNQFITDAIQGGGGTAINMNVNEVIANRANEIMGGGLGTYEFIHPNDTVNFGQTSNDVIPTAARIATIQLARKFLIELKKLQKAYLDKANEYRNVLKMGRTHLQDAAPITFGQIFDSLAATIDRDLSRLDRCLERLEYVNIGAGLVGTGLNVNEVYRQQIILRLKEYSKIDLKPAKDYVDQTRNLDSFINVSGALKTVATNLSKSASDLRLMASGPSAGLSEIKLPFVQIGSTVSPDKNNPVIPEVVNQICFQVIGKDLTVTMAAEAGQFEYNVFTPVIFGNIFDEIDYLRRAARVFREKCIEGLEVNVEKCLNDVLSGSWVTTVLAPHIGFDVCHELATESYKTGISVRELVLQKGYLTEKQLNQILDLDKITKPGMLDYNKK